MSLRFGVAVERVNFGWMLQSDESPKAGHGLDPRALKIHTLMRCRPLLAIRGNDGGGANQTNASSQTLSSLALSFKTLVSRFRL